MLAFLIVLLILDGLFLMAVVLMQAGKGGGLAAVGGGAATDNFIGGRQAANLLTKSTWVSAGIFLFLSLVLAVMSSRGTTGPESILQQEFQQAPATPQPLDLPGTGADEGGFEGQEPATLPGTGEAAPPTGEAAPATQP